MNAFLVSAAMRRVTARTVTIAMLLPTLVACTTMPGANPGDARLDGIVVDGNRLAQQSEPGLATVTGRDGVRQEAYTGMSCAPVTASTPARALMR